MANIEQYINSELVYEDDFLLDERGVVIMCTYEEPIMKIAAEIVANNGGDILNIGFGLGIIDHFIQLKNPKSHTIIEPHKQLFNEALKNGWNINVEMINEPWSIAVDSFIKEGRKFDGIYYDTNNQLMYNSSDESFSNFVEKLKYILKENGVFSYFLNSVANGKEQQTINDLAKEDLYNVNLINLNIDYDERKLKNRNGYTISKEHYIPVVRFKKK